MAFDRTKPADTDYISASAANLRENFRALAEDTRLYGTGAPESSAGQNGWRYVDTATGDEYLKVNNAWIKKTNLAALITTLLGEDIYKRSNIIGTVGQISGVPIGAVFESGSNSNGEYIKFADGTLVCVIIRSMSITTPNGSAGWWYTNEWGITLPAAYISASFVATGTTKIGAGLPMCAGSFPISEDAVNVYIISPIQITTATNAVMRLMTIGRWY